MLGHELGNSLGRARSSDEHFSSERLESQGELRSKGIAERFVGLSVQAVTSA